MRRMNTARSTGTLLLRSLVLLLLCVPVALAQEPLAFDDAAAAAQLAEIADRLDDEGVDSGYLVDARSRAARIEVAAATCAADTMSIRGRLEERFAPLKDVDPDDLSPETQAQRQELRTALDAAIARQAACEGLVDSAQLIIAVVTEGQNRLAQRFLSRRAESFFTLLRNFPQRVVTWPSRLRAAMQVELATGVTRTGLAWLLIVSLAAAATAGVAVRRRFAAWYEAAGGNEAPPQMRYLLPKPLCEYAPLWIPGIVFLLILLFSVENASSSMPIIRVAWAIVVFGLGSVLINWATGPLSPSADIKGLIPDHVGPLRLRLRAFLAVICTSYVVLGGIWLSVRMSEPQIEGRATMILLVGASVLWALLYLGRIPDLQNRYRALRYGAIGAVALGLLALFVGYQNFAGYIVQGIARTALAVFVLWIFLWLFAFIFTYLVEQDSEAAASVRTTLGISGKRSASGIGFMQLVADLVLWISVVVYLIYVWDKTGTTLTQLHDVITQGWTIGEVRVVPRNIVGSILIFAGLIVVVGWMKRWVDRRWLQRIVIERGARDAILTLFGYVGFLVAVVLALILADVDLTGLAIISGALALGLGFGMQEIANNFVSGLILLFERPIRTGDFVSVGDVEGYVRSIRIRATEIETLDNQNVLVPNSELVSGRVTNWVLRDSHGRLCVPVGVAYGSDTAQVREILERLGREHPDVITDDRAPAPKALFIGFGDSSLNFELRVRVKRIDSRYFVLSDLNFAIDQAFREAGISIPFPQRDLHIVSYPATSQAAKPVPATPQPQPSRPPEMATRSHEAEMKSAASREEIWSAITDIDQLKRWLVRDGELEQNIGGNVKLTLRDGHQTQGRVDIFLPQQRLRIALLPAADEEPLSSGPVTADLTLRSRDDETILHITIAGIPGSEDWEEYYRLSVDRWRDALAVLRHEVLKK